MRRNRRSPCNSESFINQTSRDRGRNFNKQLFVTPTVAHPDVSYNTIFNHNTRNRIKSIDSSFSFNTHINIPSTLDTIKTKESTQQKTLSFSLCFYLVIVCIIAAYSQRHLLCTSDARFHSSPSFYSLVVSIHPTTILQQLSGPHELPLPSVATRKQLSTYSAHSHLIRDQKRRSKFSSVSTSLVRSVSLVF